MTPREITSARAALGLTQAELAAVMGYQDKSRISELERGKRAPSPAAERLIRAYLDGYRPPDWPENNAQSNVAHLIADQIWKYIGSIPDDAIALVPSWTLQITYFNPDEEPVIWAVIEDCELDPFLIHFEMKGVIRIYTDEWSSLSLSAEQMVRLLALCNRASKIIDAI